MLRRTVLSASVFAVAVGSSSFVLAQAAPAKPKGTTVKLDATVDQVVAGQGILATSKDGKGTKYAIGFGPASKFGLVGNASVDFLEPGQFIQMEVEMDGEVKPMKEVTSVTIIQQSNLNQPTVTAKKGPDQVAGEPGPYIVRGTVRSNKNNQLTVSAGSKQVVVTLAAAASVPVNFPNWTLAKPGDSVAGSGIQVPGGNGSATLIYADQVEIKAAMPITKPGKK